MELKKHILVAPLNWGLGHATRCIPIINALLKNNFIPVLASDGIALDLLRKEFPELKAIELPSYNIRYSKKGKSLKVKLLMDSPKMIKAIKAEKKLVKKLVEGNVIHGIISDSRFGVYNKNVPSVFVSHQLNVLSGNTSWISTKLHQQIIKKFDECWVPDVKHEHSLSGKLGHGKQTGLNLKYIGPLSRFKKADCNINNGLLVLLSGPEPQRTILEIKLLKELKKFKGSIILVKGIVENAQTKTRNGNMIIFNFMTSTELEKTINKSHLVLSRSGYTTIMDLAKLEKKAFFIPTPGQFEQEYLANRLDELKLVPSCNQDEFKIEMLDKVQTYYGLNALNYDLDYTNLFNLFQGERKFTAYS